jgi:hypothetical protein
LRQNRAAAKFNTIFLMAGNFKTRRIGKFFFGAMMAIFALQKVQGRDFYLALLGPPPLRFQATATNEVAFIRELALPMSKDTKVSVTILSTNSPSLKKGRNASAKSAKPEKSSRILNDAAKNAKGRLNPANNLLSTMPQMINQDLRPDRPADDTGMYQPGDIIFVPAELTFVPPMPGQNRAIYRSR